MNWTMYWKTTKGKVKSKEVPTNDPMQLPDGVTDFEFVEHRTLQIPGKEPFVTKHTDERALKRLQFYAKHHKLSKFGCDLSKVRKMTPRQKLWMHHIIAEIENPPEYDVKLLQILIHLLYARIAGEITNPVLRVNMDGQVFKIKLYLNGQFRFGAMIVSRGKFLGRIHRNGDLDCKDSAVVDVLKKVNEDPLEHARQYGSRLGSCCFCGRVLTHSVSIELGYGPICADNWGMYHDYSDKELKNAVHVRREAADVDAVMAQIKEVLTR